MKKTLVFSDVHLKASPEDLDRHREFISFLRGFGGGDFDRIICLGDLFDFWFEYRHVIFSEFFEVLRAFADLRDAGIELHLVCGNHDFWAGRFLRDTLGFQIHPAPVTLPFAEQCVHFAHGDGINPSDTGYRIYKRFARHPFVIGAFRLIHPDWAMAIAQAVSHGSRTYLGVENPHEGPEARALSAYAAGILAAGEADAVMCGHAHAPVREEHPTPTGTGTGLYFNTGDWLGHRSYVVWDGAEFRLEQASLPTGEKERV